jgi:hypothetical protein
MREHYILNMHPDSKEVFEWIFRNNIHFEVHLNRTRFSVPEDLYTEFYLWYMDSCPRVLDTAQEESQAKSYN